MLKRILFGIFLLFSTVTKIQAFENTIYKSLVVQNKTNVPVNLFVRRWQPFQEDAYRQTVIHPGESKEITSKDMLFDQPEPDSGIIQVRVLYDFNNGVIMSFRDLIPLHNFAKKTKTLTITH